MDELSQSLFKSRIGDTVRFSSNDLIGRVVSLKDIESKPELNGTYGLIKEYDKAKDRYAIQLLDHSSSVVNTNFSLMKYEKLIILAPKKYLGTSAYYYTFTWDQYLDADPLHCDILKLGIINIPSGTSTLDSFDDRLKLISPCLLKGVPSTTICDKGYHMPSSCMSALLHIATTELIEVENILFTSPKNLLLSIAVHKGCVVFRWCRFKGDGQGIVVADTTSSIQTINTHVTFENCVFDSSPCGALVTAGSKAVFLNCHFINNSTTGIACQKTGQADIIASTFSNNKRGIEVSDKASICNLSFCRIVSSKHKGIIVNVGAKAVLNNCHISNSTYYAVEVDGSTLEAKNCTFVETFYYGLEIHGRNCDVKIDYCTIANNKEYGFVVNIDCTGQIRLNNCNIHSNGKKDIDNNGLSKCELIIDGNLFPTNGEVVAEYNSNPSNFSEIFRQNISASSSLKTQRDLKSAGVIDLAPTCGHCSNQEPPGKRFDKCSICMEVVYCTKDCQKLDWKKHKKVCKKVLKNPSEFDPTLESDATRRTILTSIPTTHTQIKVSGLILDEIHAGKYITGTIIHSPIGFKETIFFSLNPENDSCEFIMVELKSFYFFDFNYSQKEYKEIGKESGLFIGRRICLLNPYCKLGACSRLTVSAIKLNVVLLGSV